VNRGHNAALITELQISIGEGGRIDRCFINKHTHVSTRGTQPHTTYGRGGEEELNEPTRENWERTEGRGSEGNRWASSGSGQEITWRSRRKQGIGVFWK